MSTGSNSRRGIDERPAEILLIAEAIVRSIFSDCVPGHDCPLKPYSR
jgi:hypothetical protein